MSIMPYRLILKLIYISYCFCLSFAVFAKAASIPKIIIAADDSYPPYSYIENNQLKGIYIDMVNEAAKLLSDEFEVVLVAMPYKRGLSNVKSGKIFAVLPPYIKLNARPYIWPYSVKLMDETVVAYCHNDVELKHYIAPNAKMKKPLNIGINSGYVILNKVFEHSVETGNIVLRENKSTLANLIKLHSKRIDCYVNDRMAIHNALKVLTEQQHFDFSHVVEKKQILSQTAHIGYSDHIKQKTSYRREFIVKMNLALYQIIESEKYQKFIDDYTSH